MLEGATDQQNADTQTNADALPEWISKLPEDVRTPENLPTLKKYKDEGGIAKAYIDAQKKIAQKGVLLPGENATDQERNDFFKALGRPDKPEEYGFVKPEKLPENVEWNEGRVKTFSEIFHKIGLPKNMAVELFNAYNADIAAQAGETAKTVKKFQEDSKAELMKEWGSDFQRKVQKAAAAAKAFGGAEFIELLKKTGMDYHPVVIRTLEKIASRIGEHGLVDGYLKEGEAAITKETLEAMMKDPRYSGNASERDSAYIKKVEDGWKALYAGESGRAA